MVFSHISLFRDPIAFKFDMYQILYVLTESREILKIFKYTELLLYIYKSNIICTNYEHTVYKYR